MSWPSPISPAETVGGQEQLKVSGETQKFVGKRGSPGRGGCTLLAPPVPDAESPARAPSSARRGSPPALWPLSEGPPPAGLPVRLVPLPCTPLNDFISSQCSSPSSCSAHISLSCSGARTKGQGLPPPDTCHRGVRASPVMGGPACALSQLQPTHQAQPIPRGCSQPCQWPVPSCQGNQTPPESSRFKRLWVRIMFALLNDHILVLSQPGRGPSPGPAGCSPVQLRCGPPPALGPGAGYGRVLLPQAGASEWRPRVCTASHAHLCQVALRSNSVQLNT